MAYERKNHSKSLLMCHLIFVCKYRKNLMVSLGEDVKAILADVAERYGFKIIEMEVDQNHIYILVQYEPKWSILEIMRLFKQISTYRLWRTHSAYLKRHFWKEKTFWSDGYFACSVGTASKETIQQYIQNQG